MVGLTLSGVPLLLAAASDQVYVMATLLAVSGLFSGPTTVAQFSTRDSAAPSDSNTQLFALAAGLKITAAAIGAGVAGQLAGLGAQSLMILVGACDVVGAGVGFIMLSLRTRQQSG
jgi:hypothetical protein